MRLVLAIATHGRPQILSATLAFLDNQERQPDQIMVAYAHASDLGNAPLRFPGVSFILTELGLTRQRNAILARVRDSDLLLFLDDDFYPHPAYLRITEQLFFDHPEVVASTGRVLADDVKGPGLSVAQAKAVISAHANDVGEQCITPTFLAYGCNMCLRLATIREHSLCFDESLPLYGWYEDWDFSGQLASYGSVVHVSNALGVHLSVKTGRISGVRMGYAQVANPIYLARKGTFLWSNVFRFIVGPFFKNMVRSVAPEAYVDRMGRFRGNLVAFRDLFTGTLHPQKITSL